MLTHSVHSRTLRKGFTLSLIHISPNPYWATIGLTLEPLPLGTGLQIERDVYKRQELQQRILQAELDTVEENLEVRCV